MEPLVSVNITIYNRADLLPRCLNSVLAQKYLNLEVIIVDDASCDNTKNIVNSYMKRDTRIIYIQHSENRGNAASRNTAWKNSKGQYIAFMDDDDEWIDNEKISKQVNLFEKLNESYGIICTSVKKQFKNGQVSYTNLTSLPKNFKQLILTKNKLIFSPTVVVRRTVLKSTDGFDENIKIGVDADFYREAMFYYNYKVFFMSDITTLIHGEHLKSMGKNAGKKSHLTRLETYDYIKKKYDKFLKQDKSSSSYWDLQISLSNIELFKINRKQSKYFLNAMKYAYKAFAKNPSIKNVLKVIKKMF